MSEEKKPRDPRHTKCECGHRWASHAINFAKDGRDYCNVIGCLCQNYQPVK